MSSAHELTTDPTEKQKIYTVNSTLLFLLAYFLVYVINQLATVFMARLNHIRTELFPGYIDFKIADNAWLTSSVISTYGFGPVICLGLGLVSAFIFNKVKLLGGLRKLFYLWLMLHSFNFFLGGLIAGSIAKGGFWYAIRWSIPSDAGTYGLAAAFGLILVLIGFLTATGFLMACDSITLIQFEHRRRLLLAMIGFPWLIGSVVLTLLKFPDFILYDGLLYLTMLLMLVPAYFMNLSNPISATVEEPHRSVYATGIGIGVMVLLILYRVSLQNGISFG